MRQTFSLSTDCPYNPRNRRNKWFIPKEFRLFRGTINTRNTGGTQNEANSRNFVPKHFAEEKKLGIPFRGTKIKANFRNFVPKHFAEEMTTFEV